MSEDVLIPQMTRIDKTRRRKIRIPLINLALILFAVLLFVCSTFINLNIKHYILPSTFWAGADLIQEDFVYSFFLIPQIPVVLLTASAIGKRLTVLSLLIYLIAGLSGLPIFALGGGIRYIAQFGFGYLFAYIPAVLLVCQILKKRYSFLNMIIAAITGVLVIHIIGILYMIVVALFRHMGGVFIEGWIVSQSGLKILYDLVFGFVFILIGKYIHEGLCFIAK